PDVRFLGPFHADIVTTDQRLADIGTMWFEYTTDPSLPLQLRDNASVGGFEYALVLERWSSVGAQLQSGAERRLSPETIHRFLDANRVLCVAGPPEDRIFVVRILP
ncbi:MAG: hypothetical protein ACREDF_12260, partial [Thermoplasmata archaeon]